MSLSGINTSYTAIRAAQAAIATTSHNIANATVEGFTRQRVDLQALQPYQSPVGLLGAGVDVVDVTRQRDQFLDDRARTEVALLGEDTVRSDLMTQSEIRFGELDAGIDVAMSNLFAGLEELSLHPDRTPVRQTVLSAMDALASRIRQTTEGLDGLEEVAITGIRDVVSQVNTTVDAIAALNREIVAQSGVGDANDLMDERDRLIDDLARMVGVTVLPADANSVRITIGGFTLVDGVEVSHLTAGLDGTVTHPDGAVTFGGELGGYQHFLNVDLVEMRTDLDNLATSIADAFNAQNAAGFRMDGLPGGDLFDASSGAINFQMIATAGSEIAAAGTNPPALFDGSNAAALAALRTIDLGGGTLLEQVRDAITAVGVKTATVNTDLRGQRALFDTAAMARESQHGVNLDEEMANLITYQRMLEAAARVMSAMDEALSTLINRTGVVGR